MHIVVITYASGLEVEEVDSVFRERSDHYRAMDGLLQKFYLHDAESGRVGGIYVFDSQASADALFETDIYASLREAYDVQDIEIDSFDVLFALHDAVDFAV